MKQLMICALLAPASLMAAAGPAFRAGGLDQRHLRARLTGFQEVTPKLTTAAGEFTASIDPSGTSVSFTLSFTDLSTPTLFSHIHFGQPGVNGGVMVFLCNNSPNGPQPRACPSPGGTVSGTFTAEDVVGPGLNAGANDQGIEPGSLDNVIEAIRSGNTYVNIHSQRWPGGELRGRIRTDERRHKD
jgi:hypothetical protein